VEKKISRNAEFLPNYIVFIDSRHLTGDARFDSTVCIVGAGIAGITIALELLKKDIDVHLIESGGFEKDTRTQSLYKGDSIGLPYIFGEGCRSRYFGGSSNCWGGWCAPMEPMDFEKREWVAHSGWPFAHDELLPFYKRAHQLLQLGPFDYTPEFWSRSNYSKDVKRMPIYGAEVREVVSQFSPPTRFGVSYRTVCRLSPNLKVFLNANVVSIKMDETGTNVKSVEALTFNEVRLSFFAKHFVLATGGIENPRLLLNSTDIHKKGVGNDKGLVGKFFMDHPRISLNRIQLKKTWKGNRLYDTKYHYHDRKVAAHGTSYASQLALTPGAIERDRLLNARISFTTIFRGEENPGKSVWRIKQALFNQDILNFNPISDAWSAMRDPFGVVSYLASRFIDIDFLKTHVALQLTVEPEPNQSSTVTLGREKDELGLHKVRVNWRLGDLEKKTISQSVLLITQHLEKIGVIDRLITEPEIFNNWPVNLEGTWHHMGTTKMNKSPSYGVVDENCRVHGVRNLFIAGSSVFPTAGANFPTITITALAIRLADHLKELPVV
jgi:choline dehydrogenase-like flavoprotein